MDARPQAVAVLWGDRATTYATLEAGANRLAHYLRDRGVGRGTCVAMLLPRSPEAYATILAILKSGAAYVPIDPEWPAERAAYVLRDSGARALVTTSALAARHAAYGGQVIRVDGDDRTAIRAASPRRPSWRDVAATPDDLCYVIYTSGSTGRPKGVMVEHRHALHLVRAEKRLYGVRHDDRVYQGASLAFDLAVEEIWLAFAAGATLVAATEEMTRSGMDLPGLLAARGVTVLSTVPTLLSMMDGDIPTLRLLILGGEVCPPALVERWSRPGRRILNTYGPTETTVIATCAELRPGCPVTLGRAVPGYRIYLLDEALRPVPPGAPGEICIGGPAVARGYVGRPDETRARFLPDPFAPADETGARMFRTGDHGRLDPDGQLEFLGRRDGQTKIRGYRVELGEVESALAGDGSVRAAACAVREDVPGVQQLVGYVVPGEGARIDEEAMRNRLRRRLPHFMIPALIEAVDALPRLPSGKLDRAALPRPRDRRRTTAAGGATERSIAAVWERLFRPQAVPLDAHFFLDLGGHSLLAARMVSELRKEPRFASVSVSDVYEHPTVTRLARALEARRGAPQPLRTATTPSGSATRPRPVGGRRHVLAGGLQALGLYPLFGFAAFEWVTPYLVYFLMRENGSTGLAAALWGLASLAAVFPILLLLAIAAKWILIGRIKPGHHPLWGLYYVRFWLVRGLLSLVPLDYLAGTPLLPAVFRLLGARIGRDVHLGTDNLAAFDLISIGDGACVDDDASLLGYSVEDGELRIGSVTVGRGCFVGVRSVLGEGSVLEDGARLDDLSLLDRGATIPAGESWAGSPARRVRPPDLAAPPARPARSAARRAVDVALYAGLVLTLPICLMAALAPGIALLTRIDPVARPLLYLGVAPLVGASFVFLLAAEITLLKWLLVGRVRPGTYPVHGSFYVRNWLVEQLLALSLDVIAPIHATLYLAPWYRALGARLGRFVELSTASSTTPDLLEIGDGGTIADEVSLGAGRVENGWMTVAPTRLGRRAFVGNSAVVPAGTVLGDESLVGVLSMAPRPAAGARAGASWLGSPPIDLPRRQQSGGFTADRTYRPPRWLVATRATVEILRVTLPPAGFILMTAALVRAAVGLQARVGIGAMLALLPVVYGACAVAIALGVAAAKWAVIGRYRPFERPLWSAFIWRLELVNALYEFLATPLLLGPLQGTPFLPWYFRLLGARVGRGVYARTTGLLEWDLVEIGDGATLNDDCILQTHLFEDRILKASRVRVAAAASIGAFSVVLYDSEMQRGARLAALSLLMKGETLPQGTSWAGAPAAWRGQARDQEVDDARVRGSAA